MSLCKQSPHTRGGPLAYTEGGGGAPHKVICLDVPLAQSIYIPCPLDWRRAVVRSKPRYRLLRTRGFRVLGSPGGMPTWNQSGIWRGSQTSRSRDPGGGAS